MNRAIKAALARNHVANEELAKTGDEGLAVRAANGVVGKRGRYKARMQGTSE